MLLLKLAILIALEFSINIFIYVVNTPLLLYCDLVSDFQLWAFVNEWIKENQLQCQNT